MALLYNQRGEPLETPHQIEVEEARRRAQMRAKAEELKLRHRADFKEKIFYQAIKEMFPACRLRIEHSGSRTSFIATWSDLCWQHPNGTDKVWPETVINFDQ